MSVTFFNLCRLRAKLTRYVACVFSLRLSHFNLILVTLCLSHIGCVVPTSCCFCFYLVSATWVHVFPHIGYQYIFPRVGYVSPRIFVPLVRFVSPYISYIFPPVPVTFFSCRLYSPPMSVTFSRHSPVS